MSCLSPSSMYIYKSKVMHLDGTSLACMQENITSRHRTGAGIGKMETNLAEILRNQPIQLFADVGWFMPSGGYCFQCCYLFAVGVCGMSWAGGPQPSSPLPGEIWERGDSRTHREGAGGPDPCVTTLLLSCPAAPRDPAAGCSFWG